MSIWLSFSKFSSKAGGHAPQTPLEVTCGNSKNTKSLADKKCVNNISRQVGQSMLSNVQICSLNNHFSNFSSKAGGQAPQTPLDVIHVIRKNIRKVNTNKMLGKKLGKSQQSCSLKNQSTKAVWWFLLHISCFYLQIFYYQIENPSSETLLWGMLLATCI